MAVVLQHEDYLQTVFSHSGFVRNVFPCLSIKSSLVIKSQCSTNLPLLVKISCKSYNLPHPVILVYTKSPPPPIPGTWWPEGADPVTGFLLFLWVSLKTSPSRKTDCAQLVGKPVTTCVRIKPKWTQQMVWVLWHPFYKKKSPCQATFAFVFLCRTTDHITTWLKFVKFLPVPETKNYLRTTPSFLTRMECIPM